MRKAFLLILTLSILLTSCGSDSRFRQFANQSANQQEFVDQVVKDNERLRSEKQSLEEDISRLETQVESQREKNEALAERISTLTERLETPPSPTGRIEQRDLQILREEVTFTAENAFAAVFTDTHSMEPVLNSNTIAIQIPPEDTEVRMGDIIAFEQENSIIVHRAIAIGQDNQGWFAITKGDNNPRPDDGKVRKEDIKGVTVAIIY